MPSHKAAAGDQRHVVEIVDVEGEVELGAARLGHEGHGVLEVCDRGQAIGRPFGIVAGIFGERVEGSRCCSGEAAGYGFAASERPCGAVRWKWKGHDLRLPTMIKRSMQ
jgi:hypothetical protein